MGSKHDTPFTRARDELMSHVIRCQVLDAQEEHRTEWLDETMDFMADRYPQLGDLQLAKLEMVGRQFLKPVIPHGAGHSALSRGTRAETTAEPGPYQPLSVDPAGDSCDTDASEALVTVEAA